MLNTSFTENILKKAKRANIHASSIRTKLSAPYQKKKIMIYKVS